MEQWFSIRNELETLSEYIENGGSSAEIQETRKACHDDHTKLLSDLALITSENAEVRVSLLKWKHLASEMHDEKECLSRIEKRLERRLKKARSLDTIPIRPRKSGVVSEGKPEECRSSDDTLVDEARTMRIIRETAREQERLSRLERVYAKLQSRSGTSCRHHPLLIQLQRALVCVVGDISMSTLDISQLPRSDLRRIHALLTSS